MAPPKESPLQAAAAVAREKKTGTLRLDATGKRLELRFDAGTCLDPEAAPALASFPSPCASAFDPAPVAGAGTGVHGLRFLLSAVAAAPPFPEPAPDSAVVPSAALLREIPTLPLDPEERGLLTVVANSKSVADIFESSFLPREKIRSLLAAYELYGLFALESAEDVRRKAYRASLTPADQAAREEVRRFVERLSSTSYYEWLGVSPKTPAGEIQRQATLLLERYAKPSLERAFQDEREADLKALLAAIPEACSVLIHPEKRREYDAYLASGRTGSFARQSTVLAAEAHKASGNLEEALSVYEKALADASAPAAVVTAYVRTLLRSPGGPSAAHREKALRQLKRGLAAFPDEPDLYLAAAEWCEALRQTEKAVEAYQRAVQLDPSLPSAREGLRRLAPGPSARIILEAIRKNLKRMSHYQLLGIEPNASEREVHAAFRELSRQFHPDRFFHDEDRSMPELAKEVYKRIVDAFMVLKSAEKRRTYDGRLPEISRQGGGSS